MKRLMFEFAARMPSKIKLWFIGGTKVFLIVVVPMLGIAATSSGCSVKTCNEFVKSEHEARSAVGKFFASETLASRKLIADLKRDGLTDEYLVALQRDCTGCYVFLGTQQNYDRDRWYATTSIVAPERKKSIVLKIECPDSVLLDHTLYGG